MMKDIKILVVDDSLITRKLVGAILEKAGYIVKYAENGFTALEKLFSSNFDLILTDINMPGMDGFELIVRLRDDEYYKKVPIILLTTENSEASIEKGIKIGADLYLIKPTSPDKILKSVEKVLNSYNKI